MYTSVHAWLLSSCDTWYVAQENNCPARDLPVSTEKAEKILVGLGVLKFWRQKILQIAVCTQLHTRSYAKTVKIFANEKFQPIKMVANEELNQ